MSLVYFPGKVWISWIFLSCLSLGFTSVIISLRDLFFRPMFPNPFLADSQTVHIFTWSCEEAKPWTACRSPRTGVGNTALDQWRAATESTPRLPFCWLVATIIDCTGAPAFSFQINHPSFASLKNPSFQVEQNLQDAQFGGGNAEMI